MRVIALALLALSLASCTPKAKDNHAWLYVCEACGNAYYSAEDAYKCHHIMARAYYSTINGNIIIEDKE
jgi:hypothetical protein